MKVLWLGNNVLPDIAKKENLPSSVFGGWMVYLSKLLATQPGIELVYLFDYSSNLSGTIGNLKYYGITLNKKNPETYKADITKILEIETPDVIHIWGTEQQHALLMTQCCAETNRLDKLVVSIQGLLSIYSQHFTAYLPFKAIHGFTPKDWRRGNVAYAQKQFQKQGKNEIATIQLLKNVIGRTEWDKACVYNINKNARYFFNNEMLREPFYQGDSWSINTCTPHTIFCSQASYPIKGLHLMLEALAEVKKDYPDCKLYIGGPNPYHVSFWKQGAYQKYILHLIKDYFLTDNVIFTGMLSAEEMKESYLRANAFVCSSSIENSPNSVCEAMMLGVPTVASRVGGTHSLITHGIDGYLYPADEPYMLAYYIKQLFADPALVTTFSEQSKRTAQKRHDKETILSDLVTIYREISQ